MLPISEVPANASRYFDSYNEAVQQPVGKIKISHHQIENYYHNPLFDSSLIRHDKYYYTNDDFQIVNSMNVFYRLVNRYNIDNIVEIGCGQGAFVKNIYEKGINVVGYDPVLKDNNLNLRAEYFDPKKIEKDIKITYVMRCVLPHIQRPWDFVESILSRNPKANIYVEFQRLDWILDNKSWQSISYDHVNLLKIEDFENRYKIIESGLFSEGEWAFILFEKKEEVKSKIKNSTEKNDYQFQKLFEYKNIQIEQVLSLKRPFIVHGAAGKGILFSYTLKSMGASEFFCIDSDSGRQGKYLDCSGVQVINPSAAIQKLGRGILVLVMNQNHTKAVKEYYGNMAEVLSFSNFPFKS